MKGECEVLHEQERVRLQQMLIYEEAAYLKGRQGVAGLDEAGRGPLAGPVVAAACLLPRGLLVAQVNDSKKLSAKVREHLFERLMSDPAIFYSVSIVDPQEIDAINIYQATVQAMHRAVQKLKVSVDCLLVDGMHLHYPEVECVRIVKGDQLSQSIAAASIIAKETRDRLMCAYDEQWPMYGFKQHKGYGTAKHLAALEEHGPCPIHRLSFEPVKSLVGR